MHWNLSLQRRDFAPPTSVSRHGLVLAGKRRQRTRSQVSRPQWLEPRSLLAADLIISEFLADNTGGLADQDGDFSDWIEIRNTTAAPVSLANWSLTDSDNNLTKWQFPAAETIPAGGYKVVFASGKDRRTADSELHTNFKLSAEGEYLALVRPDETIATEYSASFAQHPDVSFGIGQQVTIEPVVDAGVAAKFLVPNSGALGTNWTTEGFDASSWTNVTTGVGYQHQVPGFLVRNIKANIVVDSLPLAEQVAGEPTMQSSVTTENRGVINYIGAGGGSANYSGDLPFPGMTAGIDYDDFVLEATGRVTIPAAGNWTFGVNSDDGFSLQLKNGGTTFSMSYPLPRGPGDTLQTFNFPAAGVYDLRLLFYERGGGSEVELFAAQGPFATFNAAAFRLVGNTAGGGLAVTSNPTAGGNVAGGFASNVETAMYGVNASSYLRVPFNVASTAGISSLFLRMKYDDGFVAYLNGQEIARRNAPASPVYNSTAGGDRAASLAVVYEDINVTADIGLLHNGQNVLAIHALNDAANSNDFLLTPALAEITTVETAQRYFSSPTPGAANVSAGVVDFVQPLNFSSERGFYEGPIDVAITTTTPGATIRYTVDGSEPTATTGTIYTGPVHITSTTTLRAIAYKQDFQGTEPVTQTYIFLDNVISQTRPAGYPTNWGSGTADYDMDPAVVNNPLYNATLKQDLQTIPSISLVMDFDDVFGPGGIYSNPNGEGLAWERPGSFEIIYPDGSDGYQVNAGVRMYGGVGRFEQFRKHSFRLLFKEQYGDTKLRFPIFPDSEVDTFDTIILRSGFNNSYVIGQGEAQRAEYIRDQFIRDSQLAMGQPGSHGTFMHLYVNGIYWGLYNPSERPDAAFASSYLGGEKENWDALNAGAAIDGTKATWDTMMGLANVGVSTPQQYQAIQQYLDVPNLIDYMLVNFYGGNLDWDDHNWYSAREREPGAGYKFFAWDSERTLENTTGDDRTGVNQNDKPSRLYGQLRANPDFVTQFADRAYKHMFNGGALSPQATAARFQARVDEIDRAIIGESARWGDVVRTPPYTRNVEWIAEVNRLMTQYFPQRTGVLLNQLRSASLYPNIDPPTYSQPGGTFTGSLTLTMNSGAGTIYYTLDGSDPRLPGGAINPVALIYNANSKPVLTTATTVKARLRSGTTWSALNEASFAVDTSALRVTEIMYAPAAPSGGSFTAEDFEFIEVQNTSANPLNVGGARFSAGISYVFPNTTIPAGGRVVVAKNLSAYASRYPGAPAPLGVFGGALDNAGENLRLENALGGTIVDFDYNDAWYPITVGQGFSLVLVSTATPTSALGDKESWRPSERTGGNPGAGDNGLNPGAVVINEVLAHTNTPGGDAIELYNTTGAAIDIGGWYLSDSPGNLTKYRIPDGTSLPAGGFLVFREQTHFGVAGNPGVSVPFVFNVLGGDVLLTSDDPVNGSPAGYREDKDFTGSELNVSFGRYVKSTGTDFVPQQSTTLGAANSAPKVGPIVINEVMYHPLPSGDEFIELHNVSNAAVPLFDPTPGREGNTWSFTAGITFTLPTGITVPAGGYVLVVPIDPAQFRTKYSIPAAVPIFGPYAGALDNGGEALEISKPGESLGVDIAQIVVDRVSYNDEFPWPIQPDGFGSSLSRFVAANYGNDVANWQSSTNGGTPGRLNAGLDSTPPTVPTNLQGTAISTTRIDLTWSASSDSQSGVAYYKVYRNNVPIATPAATSYSDTNVVAGTQYAYQITAVNGDGFESALSTPALNIKVLGIASAYSLDSTHVQVQFTGAVTPGSANNPTNYAISGGVSVGSVSLGADNQTAILTTSTIADDATYTLSVNNIVGQAGGQFIPAQVQFTGGVGVGLRGEYYNEMNFTNLSFVRTDATVDFNWGGGSPDNRVDGNTFSVRWTGLVKPVYSQTYSFYTVSDDGVRLWVNDQLIVDNFTDHGATENVGTIALVAGQKYAVRMEFYENGGDATARLLWSSTSQPKEVIPRFRLYQPPLVSIDDAGTTEGNAGTKQLLFNVSLSTASVTPIKVVYATAGSTATSGTDFAASNGTLTFAAGVTTGQITVNVNGDTAAEANESFFVNLASATGAVINDAQAIGTIQDDDSTSISGKAFLDANADGIQGATESSLPGVSVKLINVGPNGQIGGGDDTQVGMATTDANGNYAIVATAGSYYLEFTLANGYVFSPQDQGVDETRDSDANPQTGRTGIYTLATNQAITNVGVGAYVPPRANDDSFPATEDTTLTLSAGANTPLTLIAAGAEWRYLDNGSDQGTGPGAAWRGKNFADNTWKVGRAKFGYGQADIVTQVEFGGNPFNRYITTYFRYGFQLTDVAQVADLVLNVKRDDGVAVYLNGTRIFLDNLDPDVAYNVAARGSALDNGQTFITWTEIPASLLEEGLNVIAVEIHNQSIASGDLGFDLSLSATRRAFGVLANDSAGSGGNATVETVTPPAHGALTLNPNGSFVYIPQTNFNGVDTFTYRLSSGGLLSTPATVTINVAPVNDAPVADAGGPYFYNVGSNLTLNGSATSDVDNSQAQLTFEWDLDYDGASFQSNATGISPTVSFATAGNRTIALRVTDPLGLSHIATTTAQAGQPLAGVVGRHVFYNQSKFDGNDAAASANDDAAIATDKAALRPGETSTFANYTSYNRGLNGLMVDIANLPAGAVLSAGDFDFKVGNTDTPSAWAALAAAPTVSVRPAPGAPGTSRVTLVWPTGAALKQWLQVTVKANGNTGLATPDVFYFGNAVGESGNVAGDYSVSITDELLARNNPVGINPGATIINRFDYNRDGTVSVVDQLLSRNNITTVATRLRQITVPNALQSSPLLAQGLAGSTRDPATPNVKIDGANARDDRTPRPDTLSRQNARSQADHAKQAVFASDTIRFARRSDQIANDLLELLSDR